jgi:hypothetical protein
VLFTTILFLPHTHTIQKTENEKQTFKSLSGKENIFILVSNVFKTLAIRNESYPIIHLLVSVFVNDASSYCVFLLKMEFSQ